MSIEQIVSSANDILGSIEIFPGLRNILAARAHFVIASHKSRMLIVATRE